MSNVPVPQHQNPAVASLLPALLAQRRPGHCLPGSMYADPVVFAADLDHVWHREWVFAGHEGELSEPGAFITLTVGSHPLVVVRGLDGELRAAQRLPAPGRAAVRRGGGQHPAQVRLPLPPVGL